MSMAPQASKPPGPPPGPVRDLPIAETVRAVYFATLSNFRGLAMAALLPILLSLLLMALGRWFEGSAAFLFAAALLDLLPYTLFGVAWHRIVLLGNAEPARVITIWQRRHWRFLGYALAITLIGWTIAEIHLVLLQGYTLGPLEDTPAQIPGPVLLVLLVSTWLVIYLTIRLSFVLPAAAVDERYGFADSWRHTKGQVLRLFFATFVMILPVWLLFLIVFKLIASSAPGPEFATSLSATLIWLILKYLMIAFSLALISTAFRICTGWVPSVAGPPAITLDDSGPNRGDPS